MRSAILFFVLLLPSLACADSCVSIEGATVINRCNVCMEVTLQELRPRGDVSSALLRGQPQQKRLMPGERAAIGTGSFAITDLHGCS
jgi:hypothetical protein